MEILKFPDPRLRIKAKELRFIDKGFRKIVEEMKELMYSTEGIGLAATQVGIPLRFFIWDISQEKNELHVVINPKIIKGEGKIVFEEGCLSIPGLRVPVKRSRKIVVEGIDERGEKFRVELEDLKSVLFQHEIDHLNGKLIIDKLPQSERQKIIKLINEGRFYGEESGERNNRGKIEGVEI